MGGAIRMGHMTRGSPRLPAQVEEHGLITLNKVMENKAGKLDVEGFEAYLDSGLPAAPVRRKRACVSPLGARVLAAPMH